MKCKFDRRTQSINSIAGKKIEPAFRCLRCGVFKNPNDASPCDGKKGFIFRRNVNRMLGLASINNRKPEGSR